MSGAEPRLNSRRTTWLAIAAVAVLLSAGAAYSIKSFNKRAASTVESVQGALAQTVALRGIDNLFGYLEPEIDLCTTYIDECKTVHRQDFRLAWREMRYLRSLMLGDEGQIKIVGFSTIDDEQSMRARTVCVSFENPLLTYPLRMCAYLRYRGGNWTIYKLFETVDFQAILGKP